MNERVIQTELVVEAPPSECFRVWTTEEGVRSFFAPDCRVELREDGPYEMYFLLENAPGLRGGEGNTVLAFQEPSMFSFSWNHPPHLDQIRNQRTHVTLRFHALEGNRTRFTFRQDGWGEGGQWDEGFAYFERAWLQLVLPKFCDLFARAGAEDPDPGCCDD